MASRVLRPEDVSIQKPQERVGVGWSREAWPASRMAVGVELVRWRRTRWVPEQCQWEGWEQGTRLRNRRGSWWPKKRMRFEVGALRDG